MKNLKIKMLLLISAILVLMLSGICYADATIGCAFGVHSWKKMQEHPGGGLKTWEECKNCGTKKGEPTYDPTHRLIPSYKYVDSEKHRLIWTCTQGDYTKEAKKYYHGGWVDEGATYYVNNQHHTTKKCGSCEYTKLVLETCTLPDTTPYTANASQHWKSGKCTGCKTTVTINKADHTYKNGECSVCGYKQASSNSELLEGDCAHKKAKDPVYEKVNINEHQKVYKCTACDKILEKISDPEDHVVKKAWQYRTNSKGERSHYKMGKCEICGATAVYGPKATPCTYDANGKCTVCKGTKPSSTTTCTHKIIESTMTYESNDEEHWQIGKCSNCGKTLNSTDKYGAKKHAWTGKSDWKSNSTTHWKENECSICGFVKRDVDNGKHTVPVVTTWSWEYTSKGECMHYMVGTCTVCNRKNCYVGTPELCKYDNNNICTICGKAKQKASSLKLGNSAPAMCVGQSVSCYNLTNCSAKSGVTWTVIDDKQVVTRTGDAALLGKKAGTFKLSATKDGDTATCTVTVFANHLVPGSYGYNETTHWISGKCSRCGASVSKGNPEKHTFPAGTPFTSTSTGHYQKGTCSVCNKSGRSEETKHTFIEAQLKYNETEHWYTGNCTVCGKYYSEFGKEAHKYGESGSKCKTCKYDYDLSHNYPTKIEFAENLKKVLCFNSTISCSSFEFTCEPANADTSSITYASSNTSVFSIMGGTLKCHSKGTANLIVTTVNGVHAKWKITVTDHEFKDGKCVYCSATESDENVVNPITGKTICSETKCSKLVDVPAGIKSEKITWASSNPSVLVVTSDGKATPTDKYCGQATVMAKVDGKTVASAIVNVHVIVGDPLYRYDRSSHYHKAVCKECKKELRIFGTEEAHIYVSGSTNCKECGYDRGTQSNVPTEIRFKRTAALLCVEHCDLKAKIECAMVAVPEILPDVAAKDSLTWSSSDNSIFAIENGYVVAKQKGKAVLTAKTSNGLTATCDIEVVDHETAIDMELNYNGKYHWRYGICGNSLGDIYNTDEIEHDFVKGVCKCGKKGGGENNPSHFVDIKKNDWYEESVDYVTEKGLMNGVGNDLFSPNSSMTRAMVVTVLYRMSGSDFTGKANFSDVGENEYYAVPVAWASENGIVTGYPDGTFAPNAEVTREQLVVILYRYANYLDKDTGKENHSNLESFSDYLDISDYSKDALSWGLDEGIISGTSKTTLSPKGNASRAQVATMLMRFDDEK